MFRPTMAAFISIPANDIPIEGVAVDVELTTAWVNTALSDADASCQGNGGRVTGRLSRSGPADIVVRGRVVVAVQTPCARCLEPALIAVDAELSLLLQPAAQRNVRRGATEYAFSSSEADLDVYDGEKVVLDGFVRELIVLEIPNFPLCSESCPGIRPAPDKGFGAAETPSVDPRMAPLGAFLQTEAGAAVTVDDLVAAAAERSAALGKKPILRSTATAGRAGKKRRKR